MGFAEAVVEGSYIFREMKEKTLQEGLVAGRVS